MEGEREKTKGVETLLGNPKKAVLAMAIPMAIAMVAQMGNNLIDTMWVAGLGANALAAMGFSFPLFFIMIGLGNGIGIGASTFISRRIGAGDSSGADKIASQALALSLFVGAIFTVSMLLAQRPLLELFGAGESIELCLQYTTPLFVSSVPIFVMMIYVNILRAEGAAMLSMKTQILVSVINIILDPFFIYDYGLGLGMAGASWATVVSMMVSMVLLLYIFHFSKKKTYVSVRLRGYRFDREISGKILSVGIPVSFEFIVISLITVVVNWQLAIVGGMTGVAVFSSTWRILQMFMIPLMALGSGMVPVSAAAYGSKRSDKMTVAFLYAVKISAILMLVFTVVSVAFADQLVYVFSYSEDTAHLRPELASCLRYLSLFLPFAALGMVGSSYFQSVGMGVKSLITTTFRNAMMIPFCHAMMVYYNTLGSMWVGITAAEIIGSTVTGLWAIMVLRTVVKGMGPPKTEEDVAGA